MKKIIFIIAFQIVTFQALATCIIILKDGNSILVAADSRSNFTNVLDPTSGKKGMSICKIHSANDIYFAISGHGDNILTNECFNALKNTSEIRVAIGLFGKAMSEKYRKIMGEEKTLNPVDFRRYLTNALAMVVFFTVKNNIPILYGIMFNMNKNGQIICNIVQKSAFVLGYHDHLDAMAKSEFNRLLLDKRGKIYGLENHVKIEIASHPLDVSYPIDLLELSKNGAHWIRRKKECI